MKTFTLTGTDLVVPNVVLGLMRIQEKTDDEVRTLVRTARDVGITFLDHADVYGSDLHGCERRFAEALDLSPPSARSGSSSPRPASSLRARTSTRTSTSSRPSRARSRPCAPTTSTSCCCTAPTPSSSPRRSRAFSDLHAAGKVRAFGVSNHTPGQIELLRRYVEQPIVANQLQLSVTHAPLVAQGVAANMQALDQSVSRDVGTLDYCRLHDITVQAWSPFQAGFFTGVFLGSDEYPELNAVIDRLAARYDVPPIAIATTAWITRHPARMQVVLGTTSPDRVAGAALGSEVRSRAPSGTRCSAPRDTPCPDPRAPRARRERVRKVTRPSSEGSRGAV